MRRSEESVGLRHFWPKNRHFRPSTQPRKKSKSFIRHFRASTFQSPTDSMERRYSLGSALPALSESRTGALACPFRRLAEMLLLNSSKRSRWRGRHRQHARRVRSPEFRVRSHHITSLRAFFERAGLTLQMCERFAGEMQRARN
jgi:hypothetical protein